MRLRSGPLILRALFCVRGLLKIAPWLAAVALLAVCGGEAPPTPPLPVELFKAAAQDSPLNFGYIGDIRAHALSAGTAVQGRGGELPLGA
jgi:hypothetical protein